jgi:phosphoribosylaminoimidazole-succinocarboxamide synthase
MGSVKDLKIIEKATESKSGVGQFYYSDRYSVFDWGEMPDAIKNKGKALCMMGAFFFEKLEELGVKTHYKGMVLKNKVHRLSELSEPSDTMQVSLVQVLKPNLENDKYDYSIYNSNLTNILIPLEVIYRNSLPAGSSVFRRLEKGNLSLAEIGMETMPQPGMVLENPILDASTKLEVTDRYMSWNEAQMMAALTDEELTNVKSTTQKINQLITETVEKVSLTNEDGKVEYAFDENRNLMLVDVLGTPDECRFTYEGIPVSKEVARIYYRKNPWFNDVEEAKKVDRLNWKSLVKDPPPPLPPKFAELISQMYQSICNEITQKEWFKSPPLFGILKEIQEFI